MKFKKIIDTILNRSPIVRTNNNNEEAILQQLEQFKNSNDNRFQLKQKDLYLCTDDNTKNTSFDSHYIYHPAWAARIIREIAPEKHIDIGSALHFYTILSAFIKTEFYDYRPAVLNLTNLSSAHADLTNLPFASDSINSLSCMHTIEHIGLGRYGDPIDPKADLKAINELKRVCAPNGTLLIVVPIGKRRIQFNAHRIYDPFDVIDYMKDFKLNQLSFVDDNGVFTETSELKKASKQNYACGCYWFIKS